MIIADKENINWKKPTTEIEKWVSKKILDLKNNYNIVSFEKKIPHDSSARITKTSSSFEVIGNFENPITKLTETWMVSNPNLYNSKKDIYFPAVVRAPLDLDIIVKNEPEIAFFLTEVVSMGNVGYVRKDPEADAVRFANEMADEATVLNLVFNILTPDEIKLRCYAYGISEVERKSDVLLKKNLIEKIRVMHSNRKDNFNYGLFIDEAQNSSQSLKLLAYVKKAFVNKVIYLDKAKQAVRYTDGNHPIMTITPQFYNQWEKRLVDYLMKDEKSREMFLGSIEGEIDDVAISGGDYELITNIMKIKSVAKNDFNIPATELGGLDVEGVKQLIRDKQKEM